MHIKLRVRSSAIATLIAILVAMYFCQVPCDSKAFEMKSQESFLTLLPATTQAVVVANGPFQLQNLSNIEKLAFTNFLPPVTEPLRWYCSLAQNVQLVAQRRVYDWVSQKKIMHAAKIIMRYTSDSEAQGEVRDWRERACNILVFESVESDWNELKKLLNSVSHEKYADAGFEVFVCKTDSEKKHEVAVKHLDRIKEAYKKQLIAEGKFLEAESDYLRKNKESADPEVLISAPKNGIVLTSYGDRASLHQILNRLGKSDLVRDGLSSQLPEWKHVRPESAIYALRHYNLSGAKDPTSPRVASTVNSEKRKVKSPIDPKGIGFVMNLAGENLEYVHLSESNDLKTVSQQLFPRELTINDLTDKRYFRGFEDRFEIKLNRSSKEAIVSWPIALYWLGNR